MPREPPGEDVNTVVFRHPKLFGDPQLLDAVIGEFERSQGVRVRRETLPASSDEQHLFYAINLSAQSQEFAMSSRSTRSGRPNSPPRAGCAI
ncbi:MAG: hypothetical protein A3I63_07950 [Betaproteobacteria bacterium RIFCSPLOWO2_02_FULL_66_14]|nr:MAG: hypothetical protein A3I63_07950 [Betaproteobacteria bacterium RIFCSPLOWO2_02_FULL_66_14]